MRKDDPSGTKTRAVFGCVCCSGMSRKVGMRRDRMASWWEFALTLEEGGRRRYPRHDQKRDLRLTTLFISTNKQDFSREMVFQEDIKCLSFLCNELCSLFTHFDK